MNKLQQYWQTMVSRNRSGGLDTDGCGTYLFDFHIEEELQTPMPVIDEARARLFENNHHFNNHQ